MSAIAAEYPQEMWAKLKNFDPTRSDSTPNYKHSLFFYENKVNKGLYKQVATQELNLELYDDFCRNTKGTGPRHVRQLVAAEEASYEAKWYQPRNWFLASEFNSIYGKLPDICDNSSWLEMFTLEQLVDRGLQWLRKAVGTPMAHEPHVLCPNYSAHTGIVVRLDGSILADSMTGPYWTELTEISEKKDALLRKESDKVPSLENLLYIEHQKWLDELFGVGIGFLRKDGGPKKPRLVVACPKDTYISEVPYLFRCYTPRYKASHLTMARGSNPTLLGFLNRKEWKHSGDWSGWDYHLVKTLQVAAVIALGRFLGVSNDPVYRAAAYRAIFLPVYYSGDLHPWEGRARSGSGLFVILNCIANAIAIQAIQSWIGIKAKLPTVHGDDFVSIVQTVGDYADRFAATALLLGLKAKAEAQHINTAALVACRTIYSEGSHWRPRIIVNSVLRNLFWPGYEPRAPMNQDIFTMAIRLRSVRGVLHYHPSGKSLNAQIERDLKERGASSAFLEWFSDADLQNEAPYAAPIHSLASRLKQ